jgi:hypothetical protein
MTNVTIFPLTNCLRLFAPQAFSDRDDAPHWPHRRVRKRDQPRSMSSTPRMAGSTRRRAPPLSSTSALRQQRSFHNGSIMRMSALRHKQSFPRSRPRTRAVEIQNVMRAFGQTIERIGPQKPFRGDIPALNIETSERAARAGQSGSPLQSLSTLWRRNRSQRL